jgi:hypothetical protein
MRIKAFCCDPPGEPMSKKNISSRKQEKGRKDPFRGKFTKLSAIPETTVIPNEEGNDLYSKDDSFDAHLRLEDIGEGPEIVIDIFNSKMKDPSKAYIESRNFPNDETGAGEAQEFLTKYRLFYKIMPGT